jgi:hypothetical protein
MTIKVKIENMDARKDAIIAVHVNQGSQRPGGIPTLPRKPVELKGGESVELWVHRTQHLDIWEVQG